MTFEGVLEILGRKLNEKNLTWDDCAVSQEWPPGYKLGELTRLQLDTALAWVESRPSDIPL